MHHLGVKFDFRTCIICNQSINVIGFKKHLFKKHNLSQKEYYDKYFKKENEGVCPVCGKETYFKSIKYGYRKYCSNSCSAIINANDSNIINKRLNTKRKFYGDHFELITDHIQKTNLRKYGVISNFQIKENQEKSFKTKRKRYGNNLEEIVKKTKQTKFDRYGDEKYQNFKKIKETCKEKYGNEYVIASEYVRNKSKKTKLERYGNEKYNNREKAKQTCLELYGVDNIFKYRHVIEYIKQKTKETKETRGQWVPYEKRTEYGKYRYDVWQETKKWVKQLFENWNGLCYYTGQKLIINEEFKKLFKQHKNKNKLQPTIDHKISIIYGFNNHIESKIIGNINNLVITAKYINSHKNKKTIEQYTIYRMNKILEGLK